MKENLKLKLQKTALSAIFTCAICVISQLSVMTPVGIPISFQVLAIALCGYTLGARWGLLAVTAYLLLGVAGLPVFTFFRGGPQILFDTSGGFIFGFLALVLLCGLFSNQRLLQRLLGGFLGLLLCHLCGVLQLSAITGTSVLSAFLAGSLPFILKDIVCIFAACFASKYISKVILYAKNKQ